VHEEAANLLRKVGGAGGGAAPSVESVGIGPMSKAGAPGLGGAVHRPLPSLRVQKLIPPSIGALFNSERRCVASENVVTVFCRRVAREALCVQRLITGFAFSKVGESPATGGGVFF
jgi:hypothetical protein